MPESQQDPTEATPGSVGQPAASAQMRALPGGLAHADLSVLSQAVGISLLKSMAPVVVIEDWVHLLRAVEVRLRQSVAEVPAGRVVEFNGLDRAASVRSNVLECVSALDQLHLTLQSELLRRKALEQEVLDTRTELAQARADLADARSGDWLVRQP